MEALVCPVSLFTSDPGLFLLYHIRYQLFRPYFLKYELGLALFQGGKTQDPFWSEEWACGQDEADDINSVTFSASFVSKSQQLDVCSCPQAENGTWSTHCVGPDSRHCGGENSRGCSHPAWPFCIRLPPLGPGSWSVGFRDRMICSFVLTPLPYSFRVSASSGSPSSPATVREVNS